MLAIMTQHVACVNTFNLYLVWRSEAIVFFQIDNEMMAVLE